MDTIENDIIRLRGSRKKKTAKDMFLTAKEKQANDGALIKDMLKSCDGILTISPEKVRRNREYRNLAAGIWPELDSYLENGRVTLPGPDGAQDFNANDFVVHHPKINNITNWIKGEIIMQPLIPVTKDFSSYGRKYREEEQLRKLKEYYFETVYAPQANLVREQYFQEIGISDMMALTPEEQRQVQSDLQQRLKTQIPRQIIEDMQRVRTPDEKIRQILLNHDIRAYDIEEKFALGGEEAVEVYEEYYKIGRIGNKPTFELLNSDWVNWIGGENCDYSDDGIMAKYDTFMTPYEFILEYGREIATRKDLLKDIKSLFVEIPGGGGTGLGFGSGKKYNDLPFVEESEFEFVERLGENPGLIRNDWRTGAGQEEIAALYAGMKQHWREGFGIRSSYNCWRWTESITYLVREEYGELNEYFFSADYVKDKTKDKAVYTYPISRVYHGRLVAENLCMGTEAVPWQFFGGVHDFNPKLTICGRKYGRSNGNNSDVSLIEPAIQYQLNYNVCASKVEELIKYDIGKITMWDTDMKPTSWTESDFMNSIFKVRNAPFKRNGIGQQNRGIDKPLHVEDASTGSRMQEYIGLMNHWEREMYKAMFVNLDALGLANQYQSNAQTQSNINGAAKQLLPFHNKRRLLKQRLLNYFSNVSLMCLLDDKDKQMALFDDFSRMHLEVNADMIRGASVYTYIVDDYAEAQDVAAIKGQILSMLQNGSSTLDVVRIMKSKSTAELEDVAEVGEIKQKEAIKEEQEAQMAAVQAQNKTMQEMEMLREELRTAREERANQVKLEMALVNSETMQKAADADANNEPDSVTRAKLEIASREKIEAEKRKIEKEKIAAQERTSRMGTRRQ